MTPRIGIPLCVDAHGRWRAGRTYHYIDAAYAIAVAAAGATPVYLPAPGEPDALIADIDGLLVPGGDDFSPPTPYPVDVDFEPVPDDQLAFDRALLTTALAAELPVLGICYGAQLLGVHFGATFYYDIATDRPEAAAHELDESSGRHELVWERDTWLAKAVRKLDTPVNSIHHQAIADPGSLRVAARSPDGLIEAVEHPDRPGVAGVQWHPEKLDDEGSRSLFQAWISLASQP